MIKYGNLKDALNRCASSESGLFYLAFTNSTQGYPQFFPQIVCKTPSFEKLGLTGFPDETDGCNGHRLLAENGHDSSALFR